MDIFVNQPILSAMTVLLYTFLANSFFRNPIGNTKAWKKS
jgi:hypothetical protein